MINQIKKLVSFARKAGVTEDKVQIMVKNRVKPKTAQEERLDLVLMDIVNKTQCVVCGHPMAKGITCTKCMFNSGC